MKIDIGKYQIELSKEPQYNKGSADNAFNFENYYSDEEGCTRSTQIGIKVYEKGNLRSSAIICSSGGLSSIHDKSYVELLDCIVLCCSNQAFSLSLPNLTLNWRTKADSVACFGLFKINQGIIVHGELEISRLSEDGDIIWQRSGADIFTTLEGSEMDFMVTSQSIVATDWENRKYQFDFDGNVILSEDKGFY